MIGKYKNRWLGLGIALLVALNIVRWWPSANESEGGSRSVALGFNVEEFDVRGIQADSLPPFSRDIFQQKRPVSAKPAHRPAPVESPPVQIKSPEELAIESAQAEFAQIRCVGVSVRNNQFQAYVIKAGESYLISNGGKVGRFIVEKIVPDGVYLRDSDTDVGGLVSVSGK